MGCFSTLLRLKQYCLATDIQRKKVSTASGIDVAGTVVPFCDSVKLLGVTLDPTLTTHCYTSHKLYAAATITHVHCGTSGHC